MAKSGNWDRPKLASSDSPKKSRTSRGEMKKRGKIESIRDKYGVSAGKAKGLLDLESTLMQQNRRNRRSGKKP